MRQAVDRLIRLGVFRRLPPLAVVAESGAMLSLVATRQTAPPGLLAAAALATRSSAPNFAPASRKAP